MLASASQDKTLRVWSMQASSELAAAAGDSARPDSSSQPSELAQMIARYAMLYNFWICFKSAQPHALPALSLSSGHPCNCQMSLL